MFNEEVNEMKKILVKADGAFGRRRHSRGLWGFWDQEQVPRKRRKKLEAAIKQFTDIEPRFIGFRIKKAQQP